MVKRRKAMERAKYYWLYIAVLMVSLTAGMFYGCGGGGGGGSSPSATAVGSRIAAQIVDAQNDAVLSTNNGGPAGGFDVTFSANGKELKTVNTTTGVVTYAPENLAAGTVVNLEVVPKDADGKLDTDFLVNTREVTVDQTGYASQKIPIVKSSNPPNGVTIGTGTTTCDKNGTVQTAVTVPSPPSGNSPTASVTIPAGVKLKNKNGEPLTGTLIVFLAYFPSTSADTASGFPGGLDNIIRTDSATGSFITTGFLIVEIMDTSGKLASTINSSGSSVEIIIEISTSTINQDTGDPVNVGDKVPLWSFDSKYGKWNKEGDKTVENGGSTGLRVRFNPGHLSYWTIAWLIPPGCKGIINFTGNTAPLNVVLTGKGYRSILYQLANNPQATLTYVPSKLPITIKAYAYGTLVGTVTTSDWCSVPDNTLNLAVTIPHPTNRTVTVKYYCPTNIATRKPAGGIPILSCQKTSKGYVQCDPIGWTDADGVLNFTVIDSSKVTVAMSKSRLYEAVNNVIGLPDNTVCEPTGSGGTGGTGGTGTGSNF